MNVIYKATNIVTGDRYIGKDVNWPNRKGAHLWLARRGQGFYFHNSIRKYGEDNFIWEILEVVDCKDLLAEREIQWIADETPEYNLTIGGEGRHAPHSQSTKNKISVALRGNTNGVGNKNALGYKHTPEALERISKANKGKVLSSNHRQKISHARKNNKNFNGGIHSWSKEQLAENAKRVGSMLWWNNGAINKRAFETPGPEWSSGRVKKNKNKDLI